MREPCLGEETGFSPRRPTSSLRERRDRGGVGEGESTRGERSPGPATWRGRVSPAGRTSSSRAGVPKAASAPESGAGQVAQHLLILSSSPESAEDGTGLHSWGPGLREGCRIPSSLSPPRCFSQEHSLVPRGWAPGSPRTSPCPSSRTRRLAMAPLPTSPGREHEAPTGAQLFLESEEDASPGFSPFPHQPSLPTSPNTLRSSRSFPRSPTP